MQNVNEISTHSAMSDGDVTRLNRMYKCGPPYNSDEKSAAPQIETTSHSPNLFGVFIFKYLRGGN
jgi:hypothetical protein